MKKLLLLGIVLMAASMLPQAASAQCINQFADPVALYWNKTNARDTFAYKTTIDASAHKIECLDPNGDKWSACWDYRQRCGTFPTTGFAAYVNSWPLDGYGHFHLNFMRESLFTGNRGEACFCNPNDGQGSGFGYWSGAYPNKSCVSSSPDCPDWTQEARNINTHDASGRFMIYMEQGGDGVKHVFQFTSITMMKGGPMSFWYTKPNGEVWGWSSLAAPCKYTETCSPWTYNFNIPEVTQVVVGSTSSPDGQSTIQNFVVHPVR